MSADMTTNPVHIIGGGLAGSEAAWQLARRGVAVTLHEMRPHKGTDVHVTDTNIADGDDGTDTVRNLETLQFSDATLTVAGAALTGDAGNNIFNNGPGITSIDGDGGTNNTLNLDDGGVAVTIANIQTLNAGAGADTVTLTGPVGDLMPLISTLAATDELINQTAVAIADDTMAGALTNEGTLNAQGTTAINGAFSNASGATLHLQGGAVGVSALTIANGFTNAGIIKLDSIGNASHSTLNITSGTLTNASGAVLQSLNSSTNTQTHFSPAG